MSLIMDITLLFFNMGGAEIFLILFVVLIFFGSKKLPDFARSLGKGYNELKRAMNGIEREIRNEKEDITKGIDDSLKSDKK